MAGADHRRELFFARLRIGGSGRERPEPSPPSHSQGRFNGILAGVAAGRFTVQLADARGMQSLVDPPLAIACLLYTSDAADEL